MAYIPIRGPLAKTHPQLRQDIVRLLALAGRRYGVPWLIGTMLNEVTLADARVHRNARPLKSM